MVDFSLVLFFAIAFVDFIWHSNIPSLDIVVGRQVRGRRKEERVRKVFHSLSR